MSDFRIVIDERTGKPVKVPIDKPNPPPPQSFRTNFSFQTNPPPPPPQHQHKPSFQFHPPPPQHQQKPSFQFHQHETRTYVQPEGQPRMRKPIMKDSTTQTLPRTYAQFEGLQSTEKSSYPLVPVKPAPPSPMGAAQRAFRQNNPYSYQRYYDDISSYDILQYQDRNNERNHDLRRANLQYQDNQNQRNHERQLHKIDHIAQITNAQLALKDQAFQQQIARNQELRNMTTTRYPISQEVKAREIATAAALVNYDINSNPLDVFMSDRFIEPNCTKPFYSHSYLYAGVQNCQHENSKVKIYFINNQREPKTLNAKRGDYFNIIQSSNLNHICLVRCFHDPISFEESSKFNLCPCIDCNIS